MPCQEPGLLAKRTWAIAPSVDVLRRRWIALINSSDKEKNNLLKVTNSRDIDSSSPAIPRQPHSSRRLREERGQNPNIVPFSYRSFDRQFLILDPRVIDRPSANLWQVTGPYQVYATEPSSNVIDDGPALTFAPLVPDMHHYQGHHAGRVLPLYRSADDQSPNIAPGLLEHLTRLLGHSVTGEDVLAYVAAVVAHSGYTDRYREDLEIPEVRVPITRDCLLWDRAVHLGREIIWLHTFGERFHNSDEGRPRTTPRLPDSETPRIESPIPYTEDEMPDTVAYDAAAESLVIGATGRVAPVPASVWGYNVSGMRVVRKWISYRLKRPRGRAPESPLNLINATTWTHEFNDDLLDLLHVLGRLVRLDPNRPISSRKSYTTRLVTLEELREAGILPASKSAQAPPRPTRSSIQLAL